MLPHLEISNKCISCDHCRLICPENSIIRDGEEYLVDSWSCILCNFCVDVCPVDCIKLAEGH